MGRTRSRTLRRLDTADAYMMSPMSARVPSAPICSRGAQFGGHGQGDGKMVPRAVFTCAKRPRSAAATVGLLVAVCVLLQMALGMAIRCRARRKTHADAIRLPAISSAWIAVGIFEVSGLTWYSHMPRGGTPSIRAP